MSATQKPVPPAMPAYLITAEETARRLGIGERTLWRMLERGQLPQPIRFTRKLVRFHWPTIEAHVRGLIGAVEGGPGHG